VRHTSLWVLAKRFGQIRHRLLEWRYFISAKRVDELCARHTGDLRCTALANPAQLIPLDRGRVTWSLPTPVERPGRAEIDVTLDRGTGRQALHARRIVGHDDRERARHEMTQVPRGKEPERLLRDAITRANALIEKSLTARQVGALQRTSEPASLIGSTYSSAGCAAWRIQQRREIRKQTRREGTLERTIEGVDPNGLTSP
jgi:hypothetical protein